MTQNRCTIQCYSRLTEVVCPTAPLPKLHITKINSLSLQTEAIKLNIINHIWIARILYCIVPESCLSLCRHLVFLTETPDDLQTSTRRMYHRECNCGKHHWAVTSSNGASDVCWICQPIGKCCFASLHLSNKPNSQLSPIVTIDIVVSIQTGNMHASIIISIYLFCFHGNQCKLCMRLQAFSLLFFFKLFACVIKAFCNNKKKENVWMFWGKGDDLRWPLSEESD